MKNTEQMQFAAGSLKVLKKKVARSNDGDPNQSFYRALALGENLLAFGGSQVDASFESLHRHFGTEAEIQKKVFTRTTCIFKALSRCRV